MTIVTKTIKYSIKQHHSEGKFEKKRIVIFGLNDYTGCIMNELESKNIQVACIFDNDIQKQGKYFWNTPVIAPKCNADSNGENDSVILMASIHMEAMSQQLMALGYHSENIVKLASLNDARWLENDSKSSLIAYNLGEKVYQEIRRKYPEEQLLMFPSVSVGDAYLPFRYLEQYLVDKKAVLIVASEAVKRLAVPLKYISVAKLNQYEMIGLEKYFIVNIKADIDMKYVHPRYKESWQVGIGYEMTASRGYAFWEAYGPVIYEMGKYPVLGKALLYKSNQTLIQKLFVNNNLKLKRTVLIAPYTNSMSELPIVLWKDVVQYLLKNGFSVCTNVASDSECAIEGSVPLRCDLTDLQEFVEEAGYTILSRSGLSDILGNVRAEKIIIYKDYKLRFASGLTSFFTNNDLRKGQVDKYASQIIIEDDSMGTALESIKSIIDKW
ncbi:hypothetical protein [Lacrimispora sp.]|uniref:hypothetical protein n=1 Tax=Lacrimispora sp. TaxID=2719234 RepID=UPI0028B1F924|nr:hypothetical protein [Lacrimispora sp.]